MGNLFTRLRQFQSSRFYLIGAIEIPSITISAASGAPEVVERTLHGTVIATGVKADAQTIVVGCPPTGRNALIVGARIPPGTHSTRRGRTAVLEGIHAGEAVRISYQKSPDGLTARAIDIR